MSTSLFNLFGTANAATVGSYDAGAPGGIVQVPVGPKYFQNFPGNQGITPSLLQGAGDLPELPPLDGIMKITPGGTSGAQDPLSSLSIQNGRVIYTDSKGNQSDIAAAPGNLPNSPTVPSSGLPPTFAGAGTALGNAFGGKTVFTWVEEITVRVMLVIVGLVLVAGGFYSAANGARLRP